MTPRTSRRMCCSNSPAAWLPIAVAREAAPFGPGCGESPDTSSPVTGSARPSSRAGPAGPTAVSSAQAGFQRARLRRRLAEAVAAAAVLVLAAVVFYMQTNHGTLVVEIDDPEGTLSVSIVGQHLVITEQD